MKIFPLILFLKNLKIPLNWKLQFLKVPPTIRRSQKSGKPLKQKNLCVRLQVYRISKQKKTKHEQKCFNSSSSRLVVTNSKITTNGQKSEKSSELRKNSGKISLFIVWKPFSKTHLRQKTQINLHIFAKKLKLLFIRQFYLLKTNTAYEKFSN